eukprot:m51a1_g5986 hypothetical protein (760) ;mRNA; f:261791-271010
MNENEGGGGEVLQMTLVGSSPISPSSIDVAVRIFGFLAETTATMVFHNDTDTDLEGELIFPLDQGATLCGYAVDVNGEMVDAVVVEKEAARVAFETEVREHRRGPAIAEQLDRSNAFRTRVYPVPARGARTVRVRVSEVAAKIVKGPVLLLRAEYNQTLIEELLPEPAFPVPAGGCVRIAGKLPCHIQDVKLDLHFGRNGVVTETRTFTLRPSTVCSGLVARFWASKKVEALQQQPETEETKKKMVDIGRQFSLVTPNASLIVLETLEQYLKYSIEPPACLAEIAREYGIRIKEREEEKKKAQEQKFTQTRSLWKRRVRWWQAAEALPGGDSGTDVGPKPVVRHFMDISNAVKDSEDEWGSPAVKERPVEQVSPRAEEAQRQEVPRETAAIPKPPKDPQMEQLSQQAQDVWNATLSRKEMSVEALIDLAASGLESGRDGALRAVKESGILFSGTIDNESFSLMCEVLAQVGADSLCEDLVSSLFAATPEAEMDEGFVVAGTIAIGQRDEQSMALQLASSLVESGLENVSQMRVAASLSEQIGAVEQAVHILERVLRLRPEEPQSYRDLALLLLRSAENGDNKRALTLLNAVVERQWDKRFHQIEVVALMDLNAVLRAVEAKGLGAFVTHGVFSEFLTHFLDVDLRVVLTWDKDACDVDLHVTEPSGERCTPFSNQTGSRGVMSRDFTEGYGPIEYLARSAGKGKYSVAACLRSLPPGSKSVVATVHVYVDYGRQNQKVFVNSVVLATLGADVAFGEVSF